MLVIHTPNEYDTVLEMVFKTEFLTLLSDKYRTALSRELPINFSDAITFKVKKVCTFVCANKSNLAFLFLLSSISIMLPEA